MYFLTNITQSNQTTIKITTYDLKKCGGSLEISNFDIYIMNNSISFLLEIKNLIGSNELIVQLLFLVNENEKLYKPCFANGPTGSCFYANSTYNISIRSLTDNFMDSKTYTIFNIQHNIIFNSTYSNKNLNEFTDNLRIIKFSKFLISQPSGNNVLGCISIYVNTLEQNSLGSFLNLYNVLFIIIVVFTLISFVLTQTNAIQDISKIFINHDKAENGNNTNNSTSHNTKHPEHGILSSTNNSSLTHLVPTSNLDPLYYNSAGCSCLIHYNHNIINRAAVSNPINRTTS
ncbi:21381_t:CDS:2 [Cetraspora pellucida]|uniref:21381_t:CDS:1 n=1 Tax=Cetraspora pellucida TaxID=1433469 RepID=A0A9N9BC02_9GLOM|nr:21381_t:CDS:2 [Cetraspora pellucida]